MYLSELLVCSYYTVPALPYITPLTVTESDISLMCISIMLAALILSILSNSLLSLQKTREWIRKRKENAINRVSPDEPSSFYFTTEVPGGAKSKELIYNS